VAKKNKRRSREAGGRNTGFLGKKGKDNNTFDKTDWTVFKGVVLFRGNLSRDGGGDKVSRERGGRDTEKKCDYISNLSGRRTGEELKPSCQNVFTDHGLRRRKQADRLKRGKRCEPWGKKNKGYKMLAGTVAHRTE